MKRYSMIALCKNRKSPCTYLCNRNGLNDDIRIIADGFLYKNKYCALCHGFESFTAMMLELLNCAASVNISGIKKTIPDGYCNIKVPEDNSLGYKKQI